MDQTRAGHTCPECGEFVSDVSLARGEVHHCLGVPRMVLKPEPPAPVSDTDRIVEALHKITQSIDSLAEDVRDLRVTIGRG